MRRIISVFLALVLVLTATMPIYAAEAVDEWYGTVAVEYSDAL